MTNALIHGYEVVIGFETHTQLATHSKIFSRAPTAFGAEPNTQASAVDLALPGTLPVMNKGAVECAIKLGLAVGATGARPPRGRRRQVAARGLHRPVGHRPQSRRHAAAGDRHRARHAFDRR